MTKRCPRCKEVKELTDFTIEEARPDGRSGYCKQCRRARAKEYYKKNTAKIKAQREKYATQYRKKNSIKYIRIEKRVMTAIAQMAEALAKIADDTYIDVHEDTSYDLLERMEIADKALQAYNKIKGNL